MLFSLKTAVAYYGVYQLQVAAMPPKDTVSGGAGNNRGTDSTPWACTKCVNRAGLPCKNNYNCTKCTNYWKLLHKLHTTQTTYHTNYNLESYCICAKCSRMTVEVHNENWPEKVS